MNPPVFIELPENVIINVNHITRVHYYLTNAQCEIYLSEPAYVNVNGDWSAGGAGAVRADTTHSYIRTQLTKDELMALINKELALVHAITKAANA